MTEAPQRLTLAGWFSLLVPPGWKWNEEGGITCIFQPQTGVGSINISLFEHPGSGVAKPEELIEQAVKFGRNLGARIESQQVRSLNIAGAPATYIECRDDTGDHWRAWHISRPGQLVLLTYNCPVGDCDRENRVVDKIIKSFKWDETTQSNRAGAGNGRAGL